MKKRWKDGKNERKKEREMREGHETETEGFG